MKRQMSHVTRRHLLSGPVVRVTTAVFAISLLLATLPAVSRAQNGELDRKATLWQPTIEWSLKNTTYEANPFDLVAKVTFRHEASGQERTTEMFYDLRDVWKFRFTATRVGRWSFTTSSRDADLDGRQGIVEVSLNPQAYGFVTHVGNKWARPRGSEGKLEAFVPQYVMYDGPDQFYRKPERIDAHVRSALVEHGFTGFHVPVLCRWFDLEREQSSEIDSEDPTPDPRTFEALELLITKVHAAGGVVHLWAWGDDQRGQTPAKWGINGQVDQRLQRYIAARLGPLPGWTMGYGFDLWEWVDGNQLTAWHQYLHAHFGWPHMLGARASKNELDQLSESLDYSSYEQHRPDYAIYVRTIQRRPAKPSFSEDRFRIRESVYPEKDYDLAQTRRGLWHSAMAGGVANIWGYLLPDRTEQPNHGPSFPYSDPHAIRTYAAFVRGRFLVDLTPDNTLTDGVCLRDSARQHLLFYKEDADSLRMDLSQMDGDQPAVAVDTRKPYREIDLERLQPSAQTWKAPYPSDWAIAVGLFRE
jgi:hypothetical protein